MQGAESLVEVVTGHLQGQGLQGALHTLGCSGEGQASVSALRTLLSDLQQQEEPQVRGVFNPRLHPTPLRMTQRA